MPLSVALHGAHLRTRSRSCARRRQRRHAPYSKTKYVFTTLEQYVSAVRKFYDGARGV